MSRKHVVTQYIAISNGDMSDTSIIGPTTDCQQVDYAQYVVTWSGSTPIGEIKIQESTNGIDWSDLDFGTPIIVSGNTGTDKFLVRAIAFKYIRIVYIKSSGTGTLNAVYSASTVGA